MNGAWNMLLITCIMMTYFYKSLSILQFHLFFFEYLLKIRDRQNVKKTKKIARKVKRLIVQKVLTHYFGLFNMICITFSLWFDFSLHYVFLTNICKIICKNAFCKFGLFIKKFIVHSEHSYYKFIEKSRFFLKTRFSRFVTPGFFFYKTNF